MDVLCVYCFDVLVSDLDKRTPIPFPGAHLAKTNPEHLVNGEAESHDVVSISTSYPLFVTWNLISPSGAKKLRGCIGTFDPLPLAQGLKSYSLTAAFDDSRFDPITRKEITKLECAVSLLINFEDCDDALDWTPGVHGIRISFPHPSSPSRRRLSATYLPDVCTDQGWTKDQCLESLMRKAGYDPSYNKPKNSGWRSIENLKVERYRALKGRISYDEYVDAVGELAKLN